MSRSFSIVASALLAAGVLLPSSPLRAGIVLPPLILTVGNTGNCDHATIQAAIEAAPDSGNTVIRISNNVGHTNQALVIVDKNIELRGGYPGCDLAPADPDARTTIRGNGGDSVVFIDAVGDPRTVVLRNVVVREGGSSDALTEFGGGIRIQGLAQVEVRNSLVGDNESHSGAGIAITGDDASLLLDDGTIVGASGALPGNRAVANGIAAIRGGGIRCSNARIRIGDARIRGNTSEGNGGGLYAQTCITTIEPRPDFVEGDVEAEGFTGFATFFDNHADIDGGAVYADNGLVFWRSSEPSGHFGGRANGNSAGNSGGALFLTGSAMQFVATWVRFEANYAGNTGGAIHVEDDARFRLFGALDMHCNYHRCPAIVDSNLDQPGSLNVGGGAVYAVGGADVALSQMLLSGNVGFSGAALMLGGEGTRLTLLQSLVHRNFLTQLANLDAPITLLGGADATLIHVTMSGNLRPDAETLLAPPASSVLVQGAGGLATLANSIFTDDGVDTVRAFAGAVAEGECLLSHESGSVSGVTVGDPDYVAPLADVPDFTPGPDSDALDRCALAEHFPMMPLPDFTGRERPVFLPGPNGEGAYDIGAIERPREGMFADGFELSPLF